MKKRTSALTASLVMLMAMGLLLSSPAPADAGNGGKDERARLSTAFEVTIHRRGNPADQPIAVVGMLTVDVDKSGALTGRITPSVDQRTGQLAPSVLFTFDGATLTPAPGVSELEVRGQITGRAVNLIILDAGGPGKHIYGSGTAENELSFSRGGKSVNDLGKLGGPAVGPEKGDAGDWVTIQTCDCIRIFGIDVYCTCKTTTIKS